MIGIVEDNFDPLEEGRLKVRIFGLTDKKDENDEYIIPTTCLPWARSGCINCSGGFSVPKIGSYVYVNATDIYKTSVCPLAKVMRHELKKRGIKKLKVVYSQEEPIKPIDDLVDSYWIMKTAKEKYFGK